MESFAVGWCLRCTEKALHNEPRRFRNPMVPLMGVIIKLNGTCLASVTKILLSSSTQTPIGVEHDAPVDFPLEVPSFPVPAQQWRPAHQWLWSEWLCLQTQYLSVCHNMDAFKTVGSCVAQQNVSTNAGYLNSYNFTRITLMRKCRGHGHNFCATVWVLGKCRGIAFDCPISHLQFLENLRWIFHEKSAYYRPCSRISKNKLVISWITGVLSFRDHTHSDPQCW